jgi:hypothetical protein
MQALTPVLLEALGNREAPVARVPEGSAGRVAR